MILYLDTSAWLKLYIPESGSETVTAAIAAAEVVAISPVGYAEACAGLARVLREKRTTITEHRRRLAALDDDYAALLKVEVTDIIVRQAGRLAQTHALRGFDAIHLASAAWLAKQVRSPVRLLAYDERLNTAARALKLAIKQVTA